MSSCNAQRVHNSSIPLHSALSSFPDRRMDAAGPSRPCLSSSAAQFLLSAAAALRQPDPQPPTNDHEFKSKKQRVENFAAGIEHFAACVAKRRHDCMADFAKVEPAPLVNSKVRETVPKKNHSLDDRLRPFVPALPNLLSTAGADHQDALVPAGWWSTLYDVQANQRSAGASHARVMTGKRGTLSLWHIDHDDRAGRTRDRWMATFILMLQGELVVVMWQHKELPLEKADELILHGLEDDETARWPIVLAHLPSLQVLRVRAGEMLFMPKGTVHMVITTVQKLQVSWHLYY